MLDQQTVYKFRPVGDGEKTAKTDLFYKEEIQLALRNRGMPLEGLHYDITPTGMHYLLTHFDIPVADEASWTLRSAASWRIPSRWTWPTSARVRRSPCL